MQNARARNRHFGNQLGIGLQELEVLDHRMVCRPADLADHVDRFRLGLNAVEGNAVIELHELAADEARQEIEVPPRTTELAIGCRLEADRLLFGKAAPDLTIFDLTKLIVGDLARGSPG